MSRSEDEILAAIENLITNELQVLGEKLSPEAAHNFVGRPVIWALIL